MTKLFLATLALSSTAAFASSDFAVQMESANVADILNSGGAVVSKLACQSAVQPDQTYKIDCPKAKNAGAGFSAVLLYDPTQNQWGGEPGSAHLALADGSAYTLVCSAGAATDGQPSFELFICN